MEREPVIDVRFDFLTETPAGKDPDKVSASLRRYHQVLWSKTPLTLVAPQVRREGYLLHPDARAPVFSFASDAITHSYKSWNHLKALRRAKDELSEDQRARYLNPTYTIASAMIWPIRSAHRPTINQARGTRSAIADRIDLTLECIRQHYVGDEENPLADVLNAYGDFFALFSGFVEFVQFFHFQDLVHSRTGEIRFFLDPEGFRRHGAPQTLDEFVRYSEATHAFIAARGRRMQQWVTESSRQH